MAPFLDLFDDLGAEGLEITGIARGDQPLIDDDLGILPSRTGIGDVCLDRMIGRHLAALRDAGFDQKPGRMANRRNHLLGIEHILDELQGLWFDAQQVGIDLATGQNQCVVVPGRDLIERLVHLHGATPVLHVPAFDLAWRKRDDLDGRAGVLQGVARHLELGLLESVGGQNRDFLARKFHEELLSFLARPINDRSYRSLWCPATESRSRETFWNGPFCDQVLLESARCYRGGTGGTSDRYYSAPFRGDVQLILRAAGFLTCKQTHPRKLRPPRSRSTRSGSCKIRSSKTLLRTTGPIVISFTVRAAHWDCPPSRKISIRMIDLLRDMARCGLI